VEFSCFGGVCGFQEWKIDDHKKRIPVYAKFNPITLRLDSLLGREQIPPVPADVFTHEAECAQRAILAVPAADVGGALQRPAQAEQHGRSLDG
jgi:hypothetical protein